MGLLASELPYVGDIWKFFPSNYHKGPRHTNDDDDGYEGGVYYGELFEVVGEPYRDQDQDSSWIVIPLTDSLSRSVSFSYTIADWSVWDEHWTFVSRKSSVTGVSVGPVFCSECDKGLFGYEGDYLCRSCRSKVDHES